MSPVEHAFGFETSGAPGLVAAKSSSRCRRLTAGLLLVLALALIGWIIAGRPAAAYDGQATLMSHRVIDRV